MRYLTAAAALVVTLAAAGRAEAQDDKDAIRKRILEAVEKRLKDEEQRLLRDIEKMIDEALKTRGVKPSGQDPKPEAKPEAKPEPKPAPKPDAPAPKTRGWLGVNLDPVDESELEALGLKHGVLVTGVVPDGPAAKAGLKEDDIIVSVGGEDITSFDVLKAVIERKGAGTAVAIVLHRGKEKKELSVTLGTNPQDAPPKQEPQSPKSESDLRERIKKFLDKEEGGKKDGEKAPAPAPDSGFGLDEEMVDRLRPLLEPLGADVEEWLKKGADGKWRLKDEFADKFKELNPGELLKRFWPGADAPQAEAVKPATPSKPAARTKAPVAWLGVQPEELPDDARESLKLDKGVGIIVADTRDGSPAKRVLDKGDVVVKIDGRPLMGPDGLKTFVAGAKPGQEVELTILRGGKERTFRVKLAERHD